MALLNKLRVSTRITENGAMLETQFKKIGCMLTFTVAMPVLLPVLTYMSSLKGT